MAQVTLALRGLHRGLKLIFALIAAWSPILLKKAPLIACSIVIVASTLFFLSVSRARSLDPPSSTEMRTEDEES